MNFLRFLAGALCALLMTMLPAVAAETPVPPPLIGAIRWDAWHGEQGEPGRAVERALGPKEWHSRLPFFAEIKGDEVRIDGTAQAVMDKEIEYAAHAGLAYWAFVTYDADSAMSLGLKRYLSSPKRDKIRFCLLTEGARWRDAKFRQRVQGLMAEPGYLKVNNRPVLYLGFLNQKEIEQQWGEVVALRRALDDLRAALRAKGLGDPYLVIMDFSPVQGKKWLDALGGQALSSYAAQAGGKSAPYAELARYAERFWDACRGTGAQVAPIIMAGWDRRPRIARPMPWERWQKPGEGMDKFYETPKPDELAAHLAHAIEWMNRYAEAAPHRLALIYAWNENDEGGWLVPTLSEGSARLDAIGKVLAPTR